MKHRGPLAVFFLSLFTLGIYAFVWHVKTKGELNRLGAQIPTSWLLIVPFANLYWLWKYSEGVEKVTAGKISAVMAIILLLLLSIVGIAILQSMYNGLGDLQPIATEPSQTPPVHDVGQDLNSSPIASPIQPTPTPVSPPPVAVQPDIAPTAPPQPPVGPQAA